ncbi:MAG: carboxypeptidase regulatory-like domain-containing protein, partial [Alistipes sp.]|nr:carboxypeptidase regulatory-like domain-containing protein [Alistipes sp.]
LTVTFYCHPKEAEVTTGTITVYVRDAETNALLSGATVSGAGKSGTTGSAGSVKFSNISLGTHTFTASKSGYNSGTGTGTITSSSPTTTVTIYLTKEAPAGGQDDDYPVTGSITVYVRDASTYALLSSAYVSGGGYGGYTNGSGYVSFSGLDYGSHTFSASKSGYYSNSGTATISSSNTSPSITIYLTPITTVEEEDDPVYGSITVYVYDANTGSAISSATVSGAGTTQYTNYYGYTSYSGLSTGSYYFTASKSGYSSGSGSTTITTSSTSKTVYIYLTPEVSIPTTGSITVYVRDANTGASISGATVSGGGYSGTTNSSGYKTFSGLSFGSYSFTASKSGYGSGSGSVSISTSNTSNSVTIYLTPTPTTGSITVYVKDADTGAYISGATISGDAPHLAPSDKKLGCGEAADSLFCLAQNFLTQNDFSFAERK